MRGGNNSMSTIKVFIFVTLITLFGYTGLLAQKQLKYENVYKEAIASSDIKYAYTLFNDFYEQNPSSNRANLYFQLGTRAITLAQAFNPIAHHADYMLYINNADSCLRLCLRYLNDEELKRDNDLFDNVQRADKKLTKDEVYKYVDELLEKNKENRRGAQKTYNAYIGLVTNYNTCLETYKLLCDEFVTIKEAYLLLNSDITEKMESLQEHYDSVQYYLAEYNDALDKFTVNGYENVKANAKTIEIFRVDGLSGADFRKPETQIWNYKLWAEQFMQSIDAFAHVFQEVIDGSDELTSRINSFNSNRNLSDNYVGYEVDAEAMDSLNRFGYFPALNRLLNYQEEKLNFLTISRRKINSPDYDKRFNIADKLLYYNVLQNKYNNLESKRIDLQAYAVPENNMDFAAMNFKDYHEFLEYVQDEQTENKIEIDAALKNLQKYLVSGENNIRRTNYVSYKKQEIPLFIGGGFYRSSQPQSYITKCIVTADNGVYIAGSLISKEGFATTYVALCSADTSKVNWLKTVDIGRVMYDNCVTALTPTIDGGCFVLVVAKNVSDPQLINSTIIQYDANGKELKRLTLPEKTLGMGRFINYDDVNEQLLMAFHGNGEFLYEPSSKMTVQKIDLNNTILMNAELKFSGELINIFPATDSALLVIGNYTAITNEKGTEHWAGKPEDSMHSGIFTAIFSKKGELIKVNRYKSKDSCYAIKAVRITNNLINIVGQKGASRRDSAIPYANGDLVYLQVDGLGEYIYSNQELKK